MSSYKKQAAKIEKIILLNFESAINTINMH